MVKPGVTGHTQIKPEVPVERELALQLERMPEVINIEKGDPGSTGGTDTDVAGPPGPCRRHRRSWWCRQGPNTGIARRRHRCQKRSPVCRGIVNEQQLPVGHDLPLDRGEQFREER
jgi:hypothetical protein